MKFAAFVITYKRKETLLNTIQKIFNQTVLPEKLLILDNDPEQSAKEIPDLLPSLPLEYLSMGCNAGPAGAGAKGLKLLAKQGYDWIAWMDDDDPPYFEDVYEQLLHTAIQYPGCGCVGVVGQWLDRKKGLMQRVPDAMLEGTGILEVNNIAGNMIKIINGQMVNEYQIYPEEKLFFGFEELDLDLQIQKRGYRILVPKPLFKRQRIYHNRMQLKRKIAVKKNNAQLKRDYYSSRNMLYLLFREKLITAIALTLLRIVLKCVKGFQFGIRYGMRNSWLQMLAIIHFISGKYEKY